jgi:hypothetical protein
MHQMIEADPEGLQLPDVRRPGRMPSWPAWVASRLASLKAEWQPDAKGKYREIPTLPAYLMLDEGRRDELAEHKAALLALYAATPEASAEAEATVLVSVGRMMLVLPTSRQNEESAEARTEAYLAALDDVPPWAVESAIRLWYRGECGSNEHGEPYDCAWCPSPADLRRVALAELWRVKGLAVVVGDLLAAEPRIEFSDEHCEAMRARLATTFKSMGVGFDGSSTMTAEPRSTS